MLDFHISVLCLVMILSKRASCYFEVFVIVALCMMYFVLTCYTMSKTCYHFTASGKHVWNLACVCLCVCVCYNLYCKYQRCSLHSSSSGSSYHIDMQKCELSTHHPPSWRSNSRLKNMLCHGTTSAFIFCFGCRQRCHGDAMIISP